MNRTTMTVALALALGGTAAFAGPAPVGTAKRPKAEQVGPTGVCPTPSNETCLSKVKVGGQRVPYLETPCGITNREACRGAVEAAMTTHAAESAADTSKPTVTILRPGHSDMPEHLRTAKYSKYAPSTSRLTSDRTDLRRRYAQTGDLLAGYGGKDMGGTPPVVRNEAMAALEDMLEALQYWRNRDWDDNRAWVESCKEYAYASSFTAARFIDTSSACKGDKECVFDVAYFAGNGGIADRKLKDESGNETAKQLVLPTGKIQKNEMMPRGIERFVRANGRGPKIESDSDILALEAALVAGQSYYSFGVCQGAACDDKKKFKNVWAFHKKMHSINSSVTEAEAEEYARRLGMFRALLDKWHTAVAAEAIEPPDLRHKYVSPLDMRAHDPFERYDLENEYIERGRDQERLLRKRFGDELFNKPRTEVLQEIRAGAQQRGAREAVPAVGLLGMTAPQAAQPSAMPGARPAAKPAAKPSARRPKVGPVGGASSIDTSCIGPDEDFGFESMLKGRISCEIGKFLRAEWARAKAGQRSCLDPANARCDWTMEMFEQSVLVHLPALDVQVADEQFCKQYLESLTFKNSNAWDGTALDGVPDLAKVRARLQATKTRVEEELAEVDDYLMGRKPNNGGQILGKDWKGGDYVGDKETFGAGYDYDVGWRVSPAKKVADDAAQDPGAVCELEGSVHGNMSFDAYLRGRKFPIVTGAVQVRSKPNQSGNAEYKAHLKMFDISLYQSKNADWAGTQTFAAAERPFTSFDVPDVRPRFDVMVGPVPVSGQLWGELMFGSGLEVDGAASTSCDADNPKFRVKGTYIPFFAAFGNGQVGVGIAGLVSAGIRASLLLSSISTPISFGATLGQKNGGPSVNFATDLSLWLGTLGGRVSLYLEFLLYEEEFELFRWKGLKSEVPLMKRNASVSFTGLK